MWAFQHASDLQAFLRRKRAMGLSIGFVPTMGALHEGHLSLLRASNASEGLSVCSIFVNPTQFNDPADLARYPRTEAQDLFMLERSACGAVFLPSEAGVYPEGVQRGPVFAFGALEQTMEGAFRPGHFAGVAQVVHRLLELVAPDALYMGQKDFQQVAIVREMIRQSGLPVRLVMCSTIREANGLAMSSRNVRLTAGQRARAARIYEVLQELKDQALRGAPMEMLQAEAFEKLAREPEFRPEYVQIADGKTLQPVQKLEDSDFIVVCAASWVGAVRLIDNVIIRQPSTF
jgi:pantoate--beta-alanine ligase